MVIGLDERHAHGAGQASLSERPGHRVAPNCGPVLSSGREFRDAQEVKIIYAGEMAGCHLRERGVGCLPIGAHQRTVELVE